VKGAEVMHGSTFSNGGRDYTGYSISHVTSKPGEITLSLLPWHREGAVCYVDSAPRHRYAGHALALDEQEMGVIRVWSGAV